MNISGRLLEARVRAGLTIEEVSARTKINATFLHALERAEFDRLPGTFFTRSFLRTYARELGLSPDEVVAAYDAHFSSVRSDADDEATAGPALPHTATGPNPGSSRLGAPLMGSAWRLGALVIVVLAAVSVMNRSVPDRSDEPRGIGTAGVAEAAAGPDLSVPERAAPEMMTIEIRPSRVIWVAGTADGERVIYRLVEPGERVTAEARSELRFRVGDAGAFDYSINGSPGKPLGGPGEVREFGITRENVRSFLQ